jgi:glutamine synthetase
MGPGQQEIVFRHSDVITAADNVTTFKMAVKSVSAKNGLFASFLPKPIDARSGSGMHVNISLYHGGKNLFSLPNMPPEAQYFIAGILNRVSEITAFLNPLNNSYKRLGGCEAPKYLTWAPINRSQLIRIPAAADNYARMELRSPDPSCNHYFAIALVLAAGIEGIKNKQPLQSPTDFDVYAASKEALKALKALPVSRDEALALAEKSAFAQSVLSADTVRAYVAALKNTADPEFGEI